MNTLEKMEIEKDKIVFAKREGKIAKFWCNYCNKFHIHGNESGWRESHCINPISPHYNQKYYLDVKDNLKNYIGEFEWDFSLVNLNKGKIEKRIILRKDREFNERDHNKIIKLINNYENRDYYQTTFTFLKLTKFVDEKTPKEDLIDLQKEGNGMPDFLLIKVPPKKAKMKVLSCEELSQYKPTKEEKSYGKHYIEFKGESDSLRNSQLISFMRMISLGDRILVLCIEKRLLKNGRGN